MTILRERRSLSQAAASANLSPAFYMLDWMAQRQPDSRQLHEPPSEEAAALNRTRLLSLVGDRFVGRAASIILSFSVSSTSLDRFWCEEEVQCGLRFWSIPGADLYHEWMLIFDSMPGLLGIAPEAVRDSHEAQCRFLPKNAWISISSLRGPVPVGWPGKIDVTIRIETELTCLELPRTVDPRDTVLHDMDYVSETEGQFEDGAVMIEAK